MARKRFEDARLVMVGEMPVCDPSKIPDSVRRVIGKTVYEAVVAAFQDPEMQEYYRKWMAAREGKADSVK